jgi:hypothetical protein
MDSMRRCYLVLLGLSFVLPSFGLGSAHAALSTTRATPIAQIADNVGDAATDLTGLDRHEDKPTASVEGAPLRTTSTDRHVVKRGRVVSTCAGSRIGAATCLKRKFKTADRFRVAKTDRPFRDRALRAEPIANGFKTGVLGALARVIGGEDDANLR